MSANKLKPFSVMDSVHRIRWEVTKDEFDKCKFRDKISSPTHTLGMNGKKSECLLVMYPKGDDDMDKDNVVMFLKLNGLDEKCFIKVSFLFGFETQDGYWPDNFKTFWESFNRNKSNEYIMTVFDEKTSSRGYALCSTDDFEKEFVENKVTVVSSFVIPDEGETYRDHMEVTNSFIDDIKSMSFLQNLSDFTIVSGDTRFLCHRNVLAARSKYFEALFRNEPTKNETEVDESPEVVEAMLEFISKGRIPDNIDNKAMDLIDLSDMYGLDLLTVVCSTSLVNNLSPDNAVETLIMMDKFKHVSKLDQRQKVLDCIKKELDEVVKIKDWKKFVQTYPDLFTEILLNR